jgi:Fic family protein
MLKTKSNSTLVRMRGEIPESDNQRAMNSTIGVFPLPPHVKFPTLITGTGNLSNQNISNKLKKIIFFHFTKAALGTTLGGYL